MSSDLSVQDLLADAVLECAASFAFMIDCQRKLHEAMQSPDTITEEVYNSMSKQIELSTKQWYSDNSLVLDRIHTIPEATEVFREKVTRKLKDGKSREGSDVPVVDNSDSSTQEISGQRTGLPEPGPSIRESKPVSHNDDGLDGYSRGTDRSQQSTERSVGQFYAGDRRNPISGKYLKRYLSNGTIVAVTLLCSVDDGSRLVPIDVVASTPMLIVSSETIDEGQIVYKDAGGKAFVLENVDESI